MRIAAANSLRADKKKSKLNPKASVIAAIRERAKARNGKPKKRVAPPAYPRNAEVTYSRDLVAIARIAQDVLKELLAPALDRIFERAAAFAKGDRRDEYATIVSDVFGEIEVEYERRTKAKRTAAAKGAAQRVEDRNEQEHARYFKSVIGIDITREEPWLNDFTDLFIESNVGLIESIGTRLHGEVREMVETAAATGLRPESLAEDIEERFDVSESRARLIARDQVGKYNGMLSAARQQRLGIASFVWRTSLDERVRESHQAKEGNTYEWQDPPRDTGMPGEDYQCRCTAEPNLEDVAEDE